MTHNSLETFVAHITDAWGPLTPDLVTRSLSHVQDLLAAPVTEPWLDRLHADAPAQRELHRATRHGFVLLAHTEPTGLYRPPHDHGRGWVIYAVQRGEIEMGSYRRVEGPNGHVHLVKTASTILRPGQVKAFLPGDIHDTRCLSGPALLFRFADRDLKKEDKEEHRVTRYAARDGFWTVPAA